MGRGSWAIACLIGALAIAGCGRQSHPNDPRPALADEVTVAISDRDVSVQPSEVGTSESSQATSQNAGQTEPRISSDVPVIVAFTVANLTTTKTEIKIQGPKDYTSNALIPNGSGTFKASLPTGQYTVSATGIPGSSAAQFTVGPDRTSTQNDLLLP